MGTQRVEHGVIVKITQGINQSVSKVKHHQAFYNSFFPASLCCNRNDSQPAPSDGLQSASVWTALWRQGAHLFCLVHCVLFLCGARHQLIKMGLCALIPVTRIIQEMNLVIKKTKACTSPLSTLMGKCDTQ